MSLNFLVSVLEAASKYGISAEVNRYDDLSHTEVMYAYPVEFELKLVNFFRSNINE